MRTCAAAASSVAGEGDGHAQEGAGAAGHMRHGPGRQQHEDGDVVQAALVQGHLHQLPSGALGGRLRGRLQWGSLLFILYFVSRFFMF